MTTPHIKVRFIITAVIKVELCGKIEKAIQILSIADGFCFTIF